MNRREFLAAAGAVPVTPGAVGAVAAGQGAAALATGVEDREYWVDVARKLSDPVLRNLAAGTLKARMPVEQAPNTDRRDVTHLEALGRLLAGISPWLELAPDGSPEGRLRAEYAVLARKAIDSAVDPASPDALNFSRGSQPLVDAAFLAHAVVRAPKALGEALDPSTRQRLIAAFESSRVITPGFNNWLLFTAMVEAGLARLGAPWDRVRVDYALRQHDAWYKGDGVYGDGPVFHWDYYNSFVIQPMLVDVLAVCGGDRPAWKEMVPRVDERARRYAAILERLICPEGTFPPIGRSIAYRFGAFQALAQAALRHALPEEVAPAQVRAALTSVIRRSLSVPGTFDDEGWLRIGFAGHQPGAGETYISTGSLYLCAVGLLPLGLGPTDPFWSAPPAPWTSVRAWSGQAFPIDHAMGG